MDQGEEKSTLVEAVETLASMANLSALEIQELKSSLRLEGKQLGDRRRDWFKLKEGESELALLQKSLKSILHHFKTLWRERDPADLPLEVREGMRAIWLLVESAVASVASLEHLLEGASPEPLQLAEYQEFQAFYRRKVDPKVDPGKLGRWILSLSHSPFHLTKGLSPAGDRMSISLSPAHLILDLDGLKRDQAYELLFIKKRDGSRFFHPRLARSLKLVEELGVRGKGAEEPLPFHPEQWLAQKAERMGRLLLESNRPHLDAFLHERGKFKERELAEALTEGTLALLLTSHLEEGEARRQKKSSSAYLQDLLNFFTSATESAPYQHLLAYPPGANNRLGSLLLRLPERIAYTLFTSLPEPLEPRGLVPIVKGPPKERESSPAAFLKRGYSSLEEGMKRFSASPLRCDLEQLEAGHTAFDPLMRGCLPVKLGELAIEERRISLHRWPMPTHQEFIDRAPLHPLFLAALREMKRRGEKLLLFNLQDRTHWKEGARAEALESLLLREGGEELVTLVSLDLTSDFFHQGALFNRGETLESFLEQFREALLEERGGNFFSSSSEDLLFPSFIEKAFQKIQKLFFASRNVMTPHLKRRFIDLFYLFLELKLVDALSPERVVFLSKDGTDEASLFSTLFAMGPALFKREPFREEEVALFESQLYSSTLLYRERLLARGRFDRLIETLSWIEGIKREEAFQLGFLPQFRPLFPCGALSSIFIPVS